MARSCACAGAMFGQSGTTISSTDGGLSEVSRIGCRQRHQGVDNAVEGKSADIGGRERRGRLAFQARAPAGGPTGGVRSLDVPGVDGDERDPLGRDARRV